MGSSGDCTTLGACSGQNGYIISVASLAGSAVFLVAFAILIPVNFFTGMRYHTPLYSSALIVGLLFECVGYVGGVLLNSNVTSNSSFVIYLLGTIMGPAFITSAIYQLLPHIVVLYGKQFQLVAQPAWFVVVFLALDVVTLVIQAAGVGLSVFGGTPAEAARGINVLLAGLGIQLASIALFLAIYWSFAYRLHHRTYVVDPTFQDIYLSGQYKVFLLCVQISTVLILARTAVRFASLLNGSSKSMNQTEPVILIVDGTLVLMAGFILTFVPVGSIFRSAWSATAPHFHRARSGRRNGYRRPANISLPVPSPQYPQHTYSPGSPPYYPVGSSSPGHPMSPPLPTPPLHTFMPRSPPYHQVVGGQQQQQGQPSPPFKTSPGFARPAPYGFVPGPVVQPQISPGRAGFVPGHRRQQASNATLVNSDALW
ncbi:RTA1 like protein-domain-containing protein [Coniochaeta sp. 2T2.1]|nr:RTA1 like protein-domain-containing protein [Coniochaeta sp. 2T2.1]